MSIPKTDQVVAMDKGNLPTLQKILDDIRTQAVSSKLTAILPTDKTVQIGELVIYDDGAGTKRIYTKTGKGNLGWIALT